MPFLSLLEKHDVLCCEWVESNFDLVNVAVSLFFAFDGGQGVFELRTLLTGLAPAAIRHSSTLSIAQRGCKFDWPLVQFLSDPEAWTFAGCF
jgi:hypothetical protein